MKLTVYIDTDLTDPKEIAKLVKDHISHLGKVKVYYQKPIRDHVWWKRLLLYSIGKTDG
jgi:hypothetical protein